jgi:hypothetical protein
MTLLTTIKRAAVLAGMPAPAIAAAAQDSNTAQMVELARIDAETLAGRHDWSGTVRTTSFATVASVDQAAGLPDDFSRFTFPGGIYGNWGRINGPMQKGDWSRLTSYPQIQSALNGAFRIFGGVIQIYPAPTAGRTYSFDYITKNLYADEDGLEKAAWDADTDACFIPETLIALGVVWRWRALKGLDYGEHMKTAEDEFAKLSGADAGGRATITVGKARLKADEYAFPGVLGYPS